jgi:hypothetical protein
MAQRIFDIDDSSPLTETLRPLQAPTILLAGDFSVDCSDQVAFLLQSAVLPAAIDCGAVIVDDARSCRGAMAAAVAGAAMNQTRPVRLVGIVPHQRPETEIEPTHELIFRLPAAWANTPKATFQVAEQIINNQDVFSNGNSSTVVVLLFGGNENEKGLLLHCARAHWPVVVVAGTGGLADQIVAARDPQANGAPPVALSDPNLREIVETANLSVTPLRASVDVLEQQILAQIAPVSMDILQQAWERFDEFDNAAIAKQRSFRRVQRALILLAFFAAVFGVIKTVLSSTTIAGQIVNLILILTPITVSVFASYNSFFRDGEQWILLRGAADTIKREIFRFRTRTGPYSDQQCVKTSRESKLAQKVQQVTASIAQSVASRTNLQRKEYASNRQRNAFLWPEEYVQDRIKDQSRYFAAKTRRLSARLRIMQLGIFTAGAIGTYLSSLQLIWAGLATAVVTAFTAKLESDRVEKSLSQYNQALAGLRNIESWWRALSRWEKSRPQNFDLLVDQTEKVLESETAGWLQQASSALEKQTEKEPARATQEQ